MNIFMVRAAQSAYNRAGYPKDEAFRQGEQVARYVAANIDTCRKLFHIEDEFELAFQIAQAMLMAQRRAA